jgi:hypothetical protein
MTSSDAGRILALLSGLVLPACLEKGDTRISVSRDAALGEAPTCANVCGRVTANDDSWGGCGLFQPKDRATCVDRCEAADAGVEVWRCVMAQPDCDTMFAECESAF